MKIPVKRWMQLFIEEQYMLKGHSNHENLYTIKKFPYPGYNYLSNCELGI